MSSQAATKDKTTNWPSYNTALKQRGSLSIWFDSEMIRVRPPSGKRGRQQQFSDAAIQTCLTIARQGIATQSPERDESPVRGAAPADHSVRRKPSAAGWLNWAAPDFNTLCRHQRTLDMRLPYRGGTGPLNLLIDSTGITAEGVALMACAFDRQVAEVRVRVAEPNRYTALGVSVTEPAG